MTLLMYILAGLVIALAALFLTWAVCVIVISNPLTNTIIHFECNGCMAHTWKEVDRGVIVGKASRVLYGSAQPVRFIIARRPDGSEFECFEKDCLPGAAYMQAHTENPEEDLTDKWVYLR